MSPVLVMLALSTKLNCVSLSVVTFVKSNSGPPPISSPRLMFNVFPLVFKSEDIPEGVDGTNGPWQCDHDHKTGTFRNYACKPCNVGTGLIGDNVEYFTNALKYKESK